MVILLGGGGVGGLIERRKEKETQVRVAAPAENSGRIVHRNT